VFVGSAGGARGGSGATFGFDGWDALGSPVTMGGSKMRDIELHELTFPFTVIGMGFDADSAGAGQWRGGLGTWLRWRAEQDNLAVVSYGSGGIERNAPFGIAGGGSGRLPRVEIHRTDGSIVVVELNKIYKVSSGDVVEAHYAGGGGYGLPHARSIEAVVRDVRNGALTVGSAESKYGVIVDVEHWTGRRGSSGSAPDPQRR
jgi:N-methylhydantoinase B